MVQEISRQSGFTDGERSEITIAVDEALCNVIKHSYKGNPQGLITLTCICDDRGLEIVLRDQGEAFDPQCVEIGPPDEMRPGGRGMFLMRSTMDEVEFQRAGNTNLLKLRKHVKTAVR